ncbi:response regulator [Salipiger manganoxidans]|uniref:CHASE4 domain-containing protein n=1 Tax=Salipiger marinus TaxID=555512 RepID=UPI001E642810|nr:CHASE4 domain-containing protein [Salipiger manganoxidans]MCD1619342.1 response regulator [Salipiger manganoxidans]
MLVVLGIVALSLIVVGYNAISVTDTTAKARQERFAARLLEAEINSLPDQQRSATVWDEAVLNTELRDDDWIDGNLGAWMQDYFGHDESYLLDRENRPIFASVDEERQPLDVFDARAEDIAPLVGRLRALMSEASQNVENPYEELAEVSVVSAVLLDTGPAIVAIVPIISDTGEIAQIPGSENLHVAVRYLDAEFARTIGDPIELRQVTFSDDASSDDLARVPVTDSDGAPVTWLVWTPERPGMGLFFSVLPVLFASAVAIAFFLWWIIQRLLRVSKQLRTSEERLQQSQRLEAVGQLTGGIAHDFNNLLTIIMGNTEAIQDRLGPDHPLRPSADLTALAADRAADLTSRLLAFSRKQALQPQVTDLNAVVSGMEGMLRRTITKDIDIRIVAAADLWRTEVDPAQIESALLNLAINSRDAMPEGGVLTIETANVALDEDYVASEPGLTAGEFAMISVSDNGHGIAKEQLGRVFEPFFTTKPVGKGTGLGLSMVYGFVKQTGGHISVYSEPGNGTTVKIYFPRYYGTTPAPAGKVQEKAALPGQETILIVEDDSLISQQLSAQLTDLGYSVLAAPAGAAALAILKERRDIDLLLTDIILPGGMNGQQVAEAAKAINPQLKLLYTSGYSENAIIHHGRLAPGTELLSKPYRRSELALKIRQVLEA